MIDSASANPWLGLNTYKENDRLYGRDREAEEVSDIIENNILTVIYGRSGIGKSSLLQAGIFPRLRYNDLLPVYIRLEHNSETEYISQIVSKIQNESEKSKTNLICSIDISSIRTLAQLAASVTAQDEFTLIPRNITLVFDQFEELFTLPDKAHRQAMNEFFSQLSEMLNNTDSEHALRIVICLREDYLYFLEQASVNVPSLKRNRYSLQGLTRGQGRDVICLPRKGLVSEELAENILDKIDPEHSDVIAPAILSLFMHELYEKGKGTITQENISLFGDHIISNFYENGMKSVSPVALAFLEDRLVTSDGYRHFISYNDALAHGVAAEELERLKQRRIITIEKGVKGQQLIEFSHDVLCPIVMRNRKERQLNEETERLRAKNKAIKKRQVFIVSLVLIALGLVCVFAGMYLMMKNEREQMLANQSRFVAKEALELAQSGDYVKAMALVAEVYPKNVSKPERPFVHEAYDALRILNDSTAQLERVIQLDSKLTDAVFSNTGKYLATKNGSKISIWDRKSEKIIVSITHEDLILLSFSYNDNYLLFSTINDPNHQIFSINSKNFIKLNEAVDITSIEDISSDEKKLVATSFSDSTARIFSLQNLECIHVLKTPNTVFSSVHFSPDGKYIASTSEDNAMRIWDTETFECLKKIEVKGNNIKFSPNGKYLIVESGILAKIYNTMNGEKISTIMCPYLTHDQTDKFMEYIQFSPDGNYILSIDAFKLWDKINAYIWDIKTGESIKILDEHTSFIRDAKFSSSGKHIITSSIDHTVKIWDTTTWTCISTITLPYGVISSEFSQDESKIQSICSDGTAYIWNTSHQEPSVSDLELNGLTKLLFQSCLDLDISDTLYHRKSEYKNMIAKLTKDYNDVRSVAFSTDGKYLITTFYDKAPYNIKIWDIKTTECICNINTNKKVKYAEFCNDNKNIIAVYNVDLFKKSDNVFERIKSKLNSKKRDQNLEMEIWNFYEPQELIDMTMKKLNNYTLSGEDRRTYYLE